MTVAAMLFSWGVGWVVADPGAGGGRVQVVGAGLEEQAGTLESLDASSLSLRGEGGASRSIPLLRVFLARFLGAREAVSGGVLVEMLSGDRLRGTITGGDDESLILDGDLGEGLRISLDHVASLRFGGDVFTMAGEGKGAAGSDRLLLRAREGTDRIDGILDSLGEGELRFRSDVGLLTYPYRDVLSLTLGGQPPWTGPRGIRVQAETRGGCLITGVPLGGEPGGIRLRTPYGFDVSLEASRCRVLEVLGGGVVSLSRLDPIAVEQTPALGGPERFLFPWTRNHALEGGPLIVAGKRFERGIACHSRTRLTYAIEGLGARVFHARIGISSEVRELAAPGSVVFRVFVDGESRFESRVLTLGRGPDPVDVEGLENAKKLLLEVDFAGDLDAGDRAIWGDAILETSGSEGS